MRNSIFLLSTFLFLFTTTLNGQTYIEWQNSYESEINSIFFDIHPTNDGNYLAGGLHSGQRWFCKLDPNGNLIWETIHPSPLGSGYPPYFYAMELTPDGGAVMVGYVMAEGTSDNHFSILKVDDTGEMVWEQEFGGPLRERAYSVKVAEDGSMYVAGVEMLNGYSNRDIWLLKLDSEGNQLWSQKYGVNNNEEEALDVCIMPDGGCMLVGYKEGAQEEDFLVLRYDAVGNLLWEQTYGGSGWDQAESIYPSPDGNYVIAGFTASSDGDVSTNNGNWDYWIIKIDGEGNLLMEKSYGGSNQEKAKDVYVTEDGEILLLGYAYSGDGDVSGNYGSQDYWFVKLDSEGNLLWEQNYGGTSGEQGSAICPSLDNTGFLLAGFTNSSDGDVDLEPNINTQGWVLKIREPQNLLTANAYFDANQNGVLDLGEEPLFNQGFSLEPSGLAGWTNQSGQATFDVKQGTYNLSYDFNNPLWQVTPDMETVSINVEETTGFDSTLYFPLSPVAEFGVLNVDLSSSITRCFSATNYWLTYTNIGTIINSGEVSMTLDSNTEFVSADPEPDNIVDGVLFWDFENLPPTHSRQIEIVVGMPGVDNIGEILEFEADITDANGMGSGKAILSSELVCAYDPNDILVNPEGVGAEHYTLFEDTLNYTIRFQNTGNDTAFNVVVVDTLSPYLDINSFRLISSSHDVSTVLNMEERELQFIFNDIYLADSNVNEIASHGFVKFEIQPMENIAENTLVENRAGIYFDFNPPIITNTVFNTFVSEIPVQGFEVPLKVFLEGCYPGDATMNTNLLDVLPLTQPYGSSPWNYSGTESIVEIPTNVVDWILVEARVGIPSIVGDAGTTVIETQAGLLLSNGSIVGIDGTTPLRFINLEEGNPYYFSLRHRNHLDLLTAVPLIANEQMQYDFTTGIDQAFGAEQQKFGSDGQAVMISGDINADGLIQTTDYDVWFANKATVNTYHPADLNLDNVIQTTDFDWWFFNKAKVGVLELQY